MKPTQFFSRSLAIIAIATFSAFAVPLRSQYIGYQHKGVLYGERLSNGVRYWSGGLTSDDNYGITRMTKGTTYMLWLENILHRDNSGTPHWQVKDVLVFEKLPRNRSFFFSYSSPCTLNGKQDLDLIVMVERGSRKKSLKILSAWRTDTVRAIFEPMSVRGIECHGP